jgi:hypothetical protein
MRFPPQLRRALPKRIDDSLAILDRQSIIRAGLAIVTSALKELFSHRECFRRT